MSMPKIVNAGIDTLVVGFSIAEYRNAERFNVLYDAKAKAGEKMFGGKGAEVDFSGVNFSVSARGTKGYEWVLENSDIRLCIAAKAQGGRVFPEVYVTFRSEYLWRAGHKMAFENVRRWLDTWAIVTRDTVSRADLCMDIEMGLPKLDMTKDAVTRARSKTNNYDDHPCEDHFNGRNDTGYRYGKGDIVLRIYDKSQEILVTNKKWFEDIWKANGWDGLTKITRVEYQSRRGLLKDMTVNDFGSLCGRLADLWRYFTVDWLSIRVPCSDSHKYRWPVAEWWQAVQNGVGLFGQAYGVLRHRQHIYKYDRLMKQGMGCLLSAAALQCSRYGVDYAIYKTEQDFLAVVRSADFKEDVRKRSAKTATMEGPETNLLVIEALKLGGTIEAVMDIEAYRKSLENVGEQARLFPRSP